MQDVTVLFRCDGSARVGFGHLVRALALGEEFRRMWSCHVEFAMKEDETGIDMVHREGFPVHRFTLPDNAQEYETWFSTVVKYSRAKVVVLDVRDGLSRQAIRGIRKNGVVVVSIDDPTNRRLEADLAFYPPVPQVHQMDWAGCSGQWYAGWDWVVLRKEFSQSHPSCSSASPVVLVCMGGSDPHGLTIKAIKALDRLESDCEVVVVIGPAFQHGPALQECLRQARRAFVVREGKAGMHALMAGADIGICSFGVTAYELAAMGVPSVYLCLSEDHAESAGSLCRSGVGVSLGLYTQVGEAAMAQEIDRLVKDDSRRLKMGERGRRLIDGLGAQRIARLVMEKTEVPFYAGSSLGSGAA